LDYLNYLDYFDKSVTDFEIEDVFVYVLAVERDNRMIDRSLPFLHMTVVSSPFSSKRKKEKK
jgi:hypothetical protein